MVVRVVRLGSERIGEGTASAPCAGRRVACRRPSTRQNWYDVVVPNSRDAETIRLALAAKIPPTGPHSPASTAEMASLTPPMPSNCSLPFRTRPTFRSAATAKTNPLPPPGAARTAGREGGGAGVLSPSLFRRSRVRRVSEMTAVNLAITGCPSPDLQ